MSFVKVRGRQLMLDNKPFVFAGANCYYLVQRLGSESESSKSIEVLDAAKQLKLTVMRTWVFNDGATTADGSPNWLPIQPQPGVYDERMLVAMDRLLVECRNRGLRLLPTLTNYWKEFGGMQQYARWSRNNQSATMDDFYNDNGAKQMFRNFIKKIVLRRNTLTGQLYKDDPTILAWDMCNEPRCKNDTTRKLARWVDETARYLKTLDSNHLVTFGAEGFFGPLTAATWQGYNPYNAAGEGTDFFSEFSSPAIDFACIHMWHDQWMPKASDAEVRSGDTAQRRRSKAKMWIQGHERACRQVLRKPLVIEEYGASFPAGRHDKVPGAPEERLPLFRLVHSMVEKSVRVGGSLVGACVWVLNSRRLEDWDGYSVHLEARLTRAGPGDDIVTRKNLDHPASLAELRRFATAMGRPVVVRPPRGKDAEGVLLEEAPSVPAPLDTVGVPPVVAVDVPLEGVEAPTAGEEVSWEELEGLLEELEGFPEDLEDDPEESEGAPAPMPGVDQPSVDTKPLPAPATEAASGDLAPLRDQGAA